MQLVYRLYNSAGIGFYTGDGTQNVFIWGAQLNVGALQPYYPTTVKNLLGFTQEFDNAAWTKSNSFVQTNLLTLSEQFDNAAWSKSNATVTANVTAAPDGATTADKLVETAAAGQHVAFRSLTVAANTIHTARAYFKSAERARINFRLLNGAFNSGALVTFDVGNGTVVSSSLIGSGASLSFGITDVGNGWYRCSVSCVVDASSTAVVWGAYLVNTGTNDSYTGDGTSGLFIWGAQLVQGSTAGDYVRTDGTARAVMYPAPDGSLTADKLVEDTANSTHLLTQTVTLNSPYTLAFSFYAKAAERTKVGVWFRGNTSSNRSQVTFNLTTGTSSELLNTGLFSNTTVSMTAVGSGWYRCSVIATCATGETGVRTAIYLMNDSVTISNSTYTGDGTSGLFIWGAHLSDSASLDPYVYNPGAAPTASAYYGPRFDYDPVTLQPRGLLIEEQRTNLLLQSGWAGATTGTPGAAPTSWSLGFGTGTETTLVSSIYGSVDGAQAIRFNADSGERVFFQQGGINVTSGVQYALSVYLEQVSGSIGDLLLVVSGTTTATQNTLVQNPSTPGRYTVLFTANGTGTVVVRAGVGCSNVVSTTCSATLSRPQLEVGAFATSYIPTTTAAATRAADVAVMTGANFSNWYRQDEGTLFAEAAILSAGYTGGVLFDIGSAGAFGTSVYAGWIGTGWSLNPNIAPLNITSTVSGTVSSKVAAGLAVNNSVISANGVLGNVDTSCNLTSVTTVLSIGKAGWASGNFVNGHIRRIAYFPRRLANAELQAITS
jgi:hypothetical protein